VRNLVDYREIIGEILGAVIAVAWIVWAILFPGNMVGLVVALGITMILGATSGGLIAVARQKKDYKDLITWVLGASIGFAWVAYAMLDPANMVCLVVALAITIIFGAIIGGVNKLGSKD